MAQMYGKGRGPGFTRDPMETTREPSRYSHDSYETERSEESLTELFKELRDEALTLIEKQVALLEGELSEKVERTRDNVMKLAGGALIAATGGVLLLFALAEAINVLAVETGFESGREWIGPLLVGMLVLVVGAAVAQSARTRLRKETFVPEQSRAVLMEEKAWIQSRTNH